MKRHISDIHRMYWEIYYVHPQSGRTLGYAGCLVAVAAKSVDKNTSIDQDRNTENKGCSIAYLLAALANQKLFWRR